MWWLEEGPLAGVQPERGPSQSGEQELTGRLRALRLLVEEADSQHAEQLAALRRQIRTLKRAVKQGEATCKSLAATIDERDAAHAEQLAEMQQARQQSEAALQESEARRNSGIERWQSALRSLEQTVTEYESARGELRIATTQRDATRADRLARSEQARASAEARVDELTAQLMSRESEVATLKLRLETESTTREAADRELARCHAAHAAELEQSNEARQAAEQRGLELDSQWQSLQRDLEAASARADSESRLRVAAEAELQRMRDERRQLQQEAEQARGEYQDLQRHSAEQRGRLATQIARLRRDVDDCEQQLRERDEQIARQKSHLTLWQEGARGLDAETQQLSALHAEQTASLETEIARLRSQAEAERATRIDVECEIQQVAEELTQQLSEERQQCLSSQRQLTELQLELARRQQELDESRVEAAAATESQRAVQRQIEEHIVAYQTLRQELDTTRSSAAETDARRTGELAELQTTLVTHAAELAASRSQIRQLRHNLREAIQCHQDEQESRQRAEALCEPLAQEVALQRKRVEAFRGLAQREVAARRKMEAALKRTSDGTDGEARALAIRANIEVNERIRRLTTELTAVRNQELSVRQRAIQEIKRAQEEVQQLKDQLARERNAA